MFPFDPSVLPSLRTRKALLVIDAQADFLSADGSLPVTNPAGFVQRTIDVANAFRQSGDGDVFWVRSEFESHRPVEADQVMVSNITVTNYMRRSTAAIGGRRVGSRPEDDDEAFLSLAGEGTPDSDGQEEQASRNPKPECVRAGTPGSALAPEISASLDSARDSVMTKTDYSAFQSGKLLQVLRGRFATELYLCGALTNISIHATALDAARHGFALTLIDDCCGYRNSVRHGNAIRHLVQLTGCETIHAQELISNLASRPPTTQPQAQTRASPSMPPRVFSRPATRTAGREKQQQSSTSPSRSPSASPSTSRSVAVGGSGSGGVGPIRANSSPRSSPRESPKDKFVRDTSGPGRERPPPDSSSLPKALEELTLNDNSSSTAAKPDLSQPQSDEQQSVQPMVIVGSGTTTVGNKPKTGKKSASTTSNSASNKAEEDDGGDAREDGAAGESQKQKSPDRSAAAKVKEGDRSSQAKAKGANDTPDTPKPQPITKKDIKAPHQDNSSYKSQQQQRHEKTQPSSQKTEEEQGAPSSDSEDSSSNMSSPSDDSDIPVAKMKKSEGSNSPSNNTTSSGPTPSEPLCEGDTTIFHNVLPPSLEAGIFSRLRDEVRWQRMSHQGGEVPRLVCVQGEVDSEGNMPVYRHPADESPPLAPFSPTVLEIKAEVEKLLGHGLNHVLIQFYRSGNDYISEHSDKTLDIVRGSFIANVSLGAERTMVFRTKRRDRDPSLKKTMNASASPTSSDEKGKDDDNTAAAAADAVSKGEAGAAGLRRSIIRARLPHNSLCRMGLATNARWLHAIRQDRRLARDKSAPELAFDGGRISLTFRQIGTFLSADSSLIWGQGATSKTREGARPVVNGQSEQAVTMLKGFGTENHSSVFDWEAAYGKGFDVLHMSNAPRFFTGADPVANMRIGLMLAEYGVGYARGSMGPELSGRELLAGGGKVKDLEAANASVKFVDNDAAKSVVQGDLAVMLYLESVYGSGKADNKETTAPAAETPAQLARKFTRFQQALGLLERWRALLAAVADGSEEEGGEAARRPTAGGSSGSHLLKSLRSDLAVFDAYVAEKSNGEGEWEGAGPVFIAGEDVPSLADFALWPVLREIDAAVRSASGGEDSANAFVEGLKSLKLEKLAGYYVAFGERKCARQVVGGGSGGGD